MSIKNKVFNLIAILGLSSLVSIGASFAAEDRPQQGGTLVLGSFQAPRHLNGAVQSGMATALPSTQLFASLLRYDDQWNPQPYLAESWEWSDDQKSFTVHLRENAVFHDGQPITSEDVAFSIMAIKESSPFKGMFEAVERVDTPDPHTAIFRLSKTHPALAIALSPTLTPIMPKHIYGDGQDLMSHPRNVKDVVGSGPFKLKSFVPGKEIVLERFEDYFLEGKPYLDRVIIQINPDATTLLIGLERGDLQMLPFMADPTILRRIATDEQLDMYKKGYEAVGAQGWLAFNTEKAPFDDERVRKAIAYSLDQAFITKVLNAGFAKPADGPIVSSSPYYSESAIHDYPLDLEKAAALLDEAGLAPGDEGIRFTMKIDVQPGSASLNKNIAEYVRAQLKKVGIQAEVRESADFPSWASTIANHDFDVTTDNVWNWGDPTIGVHRTYLSNNIRNVIWTNTQSYRNEEVDRLLEAAGMEMDMDKRKALYADFQSIVTDELPVVYTTQSPYHTVSAKNVANVPTSIWGPLSPYDEVYFKP
ncbi:ABC transporter substrate-binding protein [Paenalcaligenes sp. Me131]|uniref:ABC transporter substrate-binding protein n=1 Tax=Paenalcaligenes sp. Me131 TaxID=3392636 RepID=UPI003D27D2E0